MNKKNEEEEFVTIVLDDRTELKCEIIGVFNALDREYIALLPKGKEDTIIYRYSENEEAEAILDLIENEEEFKLVEEEFYKYFE